MIADFRFENEPPQDRVVVSLFWNDDERMGRVIVPGSMECELIENDLPETGDLPIFAAIGYAVALAGVSQRRLCLTGDRTVWDCHWGHLVEVS